MKKINKHIEIARAGDTRNSSMGLKSCEMIYDVLSEHYEKVGITMIHNIDDLDKLVEKAPDLVFLGIKNMPGEITELNNDPNKVWVSEYLEQRGTNYTGSTKTAIELDFDKSLAKKLVNDCGLSTAPYFMAKVGLYEKEQDLPLSFPLFVKPPNEGGGRGIGKNSVVRNFLAYEKQIKLISTRFGSYSLAETYLKGREFSVALLGNGYDKDLLAMPVELIAKANHRGDKILSEEIKSADSESVIAISDIEVHKKVVKLAKDVYKVLGARDYGRIDIRMDEDGAAFFLEANLIPGLAMHDFTSYFTSACKINQSMSHPQMILKIAELGLARS